MHTRTFKHLANFAISLALFSLSLAHAASLPAPVQTKVDEAVGRLTQLAADPEVIGAVQAANAAPAPAMNNGRWIELGDTAPEVTSVTSSALSQKLAGWKDSAGWGKLFLRAKDGHLVAGAAKPLVYNIAKRKTYKEAITGKTWHANKMKPDPTTQQNAVQISAPVMDGDVVVGVMHAAVLVD